ncbi:MAG: acyl--CoA ligase [Burkholderiaceae bacterium]|nr:acyl--CoA ligase [Burkholderiaceae bacterium]
MPNIGDAVSQAARRAPQAVALSGEGTTLTYRDFDELVWRVCTALSRGGVRAGEVNAITFRSEWVSFVVTMAIARLGATTLSLHAVDAPILRRSNARRCGACRLLSDIEGVDDAGLPVLALDVPAIAREDAPADRSLCAADPRAPWLIVLGSGSTGEPKRIDLSHQASIARNARHLRLWAVGANDRVACAAPFDSAATKQRYLEAVSAGAAVVLWDRKRRSLVSMCNDERVTMLHANVVHLERQLAALEPGVAGAMRAVRVLRVGGSLVSTAIRARAARQLTPNLYVAYATNEFGIAACAGPDELAAGSESIGRPLEGVQIEVVDENAGALPAGSVGLIRMRGAGMVESYVGDEEATRRAFRDGWFYPGDLGALSPDGSLFYRGRADQMMIFDGINIYPAEIEQVVATHPAVRDAAAVPAASAVHHNIPVCAVSLHPGAQVTEAELLAHTRDRLGVRMPRRIVILEEIPRTDTGKLQRAELFARLKARG